MDALYGSETRAAEIMIETMGSIEAHLVAKLKIVARNILAPAIAAVGAPGSGPTECPRMGHNARRRDGLDSDGLTMPRSLRRKYELLIGGLVHQRDVTRLLRLAAWRAPCRRLGAGGEASTVIGSDLTREYVDINADYRS